MIGWIAISRVKSFSGLDFILSLCNGYKLVFLFSNLSYWSVGHLLIGFWFLVDFGILFPLVYFMFRGFLHNIALCYRLTFADSLKTKGGLAISHIFYANDYLLIANRKVRDAVYLATTILDVYYSHSCQTINYDKFHIMFSPSTSPTDKFQVLKSLSYFWKTRGMAVPWGS